MRILQVVVVGPFRHSFDYWAPEGWVGSAMGCRVRVPFGAREVVGLVVGQVAEEEAQLPVEQLKAAVAILDEEPIFSAAVWQLLNWASGYYHCPLGGVALGALPAGLRRGKPACLPEVHAQSGAEAIEDAVDEKPLHLNAAQREAVESINAARGFQPFLLQGVTGSGKTEVYLQVIAAQLSQGKQAMVLVPEIGLTPQTVARFRARFSVPVTVLHSGLTDKVRWVGWLSVRSGQSEIVIGTRSALLVPMARPGIIILDEEHDPSFKQQAGFRYSARDLAMVRGRLENIPVVLGSATPSLESLYNVEKKQYRCLRLPERAGAAVLPRLQVLDIRGQRLRHGLSKALLDKIKRHLSAQGQVLLFINRRGYAPVFMCHACGWVAQCDRCDARLIVHAQTGRLRCHHCDAMRAVPEECPDCTGAQLIRIGVGTERLEECLQERFPEVPMTRIDRDTTRQSGGMESLLSEVHTEGARVLIGTQMLVKGHHFPRVTMVAIVDADYGLFSADFRSMERMGQLLVQVAGRAGRGDRLGEVWLQTRHPEHPALQALVQHGYDRLVERVLAERRAAHLPPYGHLALFRAESRRSQKVARSFLETVKRLAGRCQGTNDVSLGGPVAAHMERRAGYYRAQLLLQARQRSVLQQLLSELMPCVDALPSARRVRWSLDVDPVDLF